MGNREDKEYKHYAQFNTANQGKPVKIYNNKKLNGKIGIYTGFGERYDTVWVRIGTIYYEIDITFLQFVPNGSLTEALYGD